MRNRRNKYGYPNIPFAIIEGYFLKEKSLNTFSEKLEKMLVEP